jgi:hypothetical protein
MPVELIAAPPGRVVRIGMAPPLLTRVLVHLVGFSDLVVER